MPLHLLQVADRQIFDPMSYHGFVLFLPSLSLLKAGSTPALCTTSSAPGLLTQRDGATGMAHSP